MLPIAVLPLLIGRVGMEAIAITASATACFTTIEKRKPVASKKPKSPKPYTREPIKPVVRHPDRKNDYRRQPKHPDKEVSHE